jgi:SAM-dependent methyltransferase
VKRLHVCRGTFVYDTRAMALLERDWTNVLFSPLPYAPAGSWVARDMRSGLPFADGEFELAYANHVVEHLTPAEALAFAAELRRVVAPGGFVRVSAPDLEAAARRYIEELDEATRDDSPQARRRHHWATILLIDQMVRDRSGGLLLEELRSPDADELRERGGRVVDSWGSHPLASQPGARSLRGTAYAVGRRLRSARLGRDPRRTLEAHRWMWDRITLPELLADAGFADCEAVTFDRSRLPGWEQYDFDRTGNGAYELEPSVYVEGRNP